MFCRFRSDDRGQVAVMFALMLIPITSIIAFAVEASMMHTIQQRLQSHLDAAVLSAVAGTDQASATEIGKAALGIDDPEIQTASFVRTEIASGVTIQGTTNYTYKGLLAGLLGQQVTTIKVKATASAPMKLATVRFRPAGATGVWSKSARLMVLRPGDTEYTEVQNVNYVYKKNRSYTYNYDTKTYSASPTGWIDVGDYEHAYLWFQVDPNSWKFREWCGSCPTSIRTDENIKNTDQFYINGKRNAQFNPLDILEIIPCETSTLEFEDGGGVRPDMKFHVDATCEPSGTEGAMLIE